MKIENKKLVLFFTTFKLSACAFGGGFVIIPLLRKKFVEELGWIEEQEMLDLTAIAQSSPGAIAVNACILVGYHIAGLPGALLSILGTVLPPFTVISVISFFYDAFRNNAVVDFLMSGMLAGVVAVIFDIMMKMSLGILKRKRLLHLLIMLGAFIAARIFGINIMLIIVICGLIGALDTCWSLKWRRERRK